MRTFEKECERKFLLKELPNDFNDYKKQSISQCYLINSNFFSIRVRKYDDDRKYLDFKFGSGKIKLKIKFKINFWLNKKCLSKDRYKKRCDDVLIIIDVFENGLRLVEIESSNYYSINNYELPNWVGDEVTYNPAYRNRNLINN